MMRKIVFISTLAISGLISPASWAQKYDDDYYDRYAYNRRYYDDGYDYRPSYGHGAYRYGYRYERPYYRRYYRPPIYHPHHHHGHGYMAPGD
jgi:hypothetical protein